MKKLTLTTITKVTGPILMSSSIIIFGFSNCSKVDFGTPSDGPTQYVCDPLDTGTGGTTSGLKGQLYYFETSQVPPHGATLDDYFANGFRQNVNVFLSLLNIPTKPWTTGFQSSNGEYLKTLKGDNLVEWFALKMQTAIKLGKTDNPGLYQFAFLSDDGTIMKIYNPNEQVLINNDGKTPTRFKSAVQPINMSASTRLKTEIQYFQGPRYHIALILLWRPWNGLAYDPADGQYGNSLYFDSTVTPSAPQPAYQQLLSRGWRPLQSENFELLDGETNPCH